MRRLFTMLAIITGIAIVTTYAYVRKSPWGITNLEMREDAARPARYYDAVLTKPVDSIYVVKHLREMYVYHHDTLLKIYRIALGDAPRGHKHVQGDEKTPEGIYHIYDRNPNSSCHKNLGISYPNNTDRRYAQGLKQSPGGDIKIHGLPNGQGHVGKAHLLHDWTNGCIAVTDEEIDELYKFTIIGSPINIVQ